MSLFSGLFDSGGGGGGTVNASDVVNIPHGDIISTNVQAAINELDDEKAPLTAIKLECYLTVLAAEAATYTYDKLVYVVSNNTFYCPVASAGGYTRDGKFILNTGAGGTSRLLAVAGKYILGEAGNSNSGIQLGTEDPFSRGQIWNSLPDAVLRLGSLGQDGDVNNTSSEGIVAYGTNSAGAFDATNWAYARIKSTRLGINDCIANSQYYLFRADEVGMYLKNSSNVKTFDIVRSTGRTYIAERLGIGTTSPSERLDAYDATTGRTVSAKVKTLTEATAVDLFSLAVPIDTAACVYIDYHIEAINTGTHVVETHYGREIVIARNQNGTITHNPLHTMELDLPVGTGITDTFTISEDTNKVTVSLTATSGISPTSLKVYYTTQVLGTNNVTYL